MCICWWFQGHRKPTCCCCWNGSKRSHGGTQRELIHCLFLCDEILTHFIQIAEGYAFHIYVKVKSHQLVVFDGGNLAKYMHDPIDFPGNRPPPCMMGLIISNVLQFGLNDAA